MTWFKVTIDDYEMRDHLDKKITKSFISFLVKHNSPIGLAMHIYEDLEPVFNKLTYYFSVPKEHLSDFKLITVQYSISEVPTPELRRLSTVLGSIE